VLLCIKWLNVHCWCVERRNKGIDHKNIKNTHTHIHTYIHTYMFQAFTLIYARHKSYSCYAWCSHIHVCRLFNFYLTRISFLRSGHRINLKSRRPGFESSQSTIFRATCCCENGLNMHVLFVWFIMRNKGIGHKKKLFFKVLLSIWHFKPGCFFKKTALLFSM
jgi:hypothetical protein